MKLFKKGIKLLAIPLFTLALLEIVIRAGGFSFQYLAKKKLNQNATIADKPIKKILILGDSTAVMGADKTNRYLELYNSYPKFLEQYLNSAQSKYSFQIENDSLMNGNTFKVFRNAESLLDTKYPDIVVSMVGIIDGRMLPAVGKKNTTEEKFNSRLYQLIQFYLENKRQHKNTPAHSIPPAPRGFLMIEALRLIGQETNKNFNLPQFAEIFRGHLQACSDLNENKFFEAAEKFQQMSTKYGLGKLGHVKTLVSSGKFSEAEALLQELIKKSENPYFYSSLIALYAKEKKFDKAQEIKKIADLKKFKNTLPIEIEWALVFKAKGSIVESNQMLEKIRKTINIEKMKKLNATFASKIIHNPEMANDFYANLESNDLYSLIFEGLAKEGNYKKLDEALNYFTTNHSWLGTTFYYLLENYILYGQNARSQTLLDHLSKEMRDVSDYYRLLVYYKFSNKPIDKKITERFKELFRNTVYNFEYLHKLTQQRKIPLVLMQYPGFNVEVLKNFLNKPDVHYLSNEDLFKGLPLEQVIFEPKYPYVRNHYTEHGSKLIAKRLGDYILMMSP